MDTTVEESLVEVAGVLKAVEDDSWIPWADQLIPNMACQVREKVETRACKERENNAERGGGKGQESLQGSGKGGP